MIRKILKQLSYLLPLLFFLQGSAQEKLLPLYNYDLSTSSRPLSKSINRAVVGLPFFDDFSYGYYTVFPNPELWEDQQAYINTTFPLNPPSLGVATLDGLNQFGNPYDTVSFNNNSVGPADTLTSVPLLLGSISSADSVYLSFLFEPGGLGDPPNSADYNLANGFSGLGDSLVLEFRDNAGFWRHIWAKDGKPLQGDFRPDLFQNVIIALRDSFFFYDGFQFRFRNYATLIGNFDQWHIDYVKLNTNRNRNDTIIPDVAVQYVPASILANYQSMPWNQFQNYQSSEKASSEVLAVQNNNPIQENTSAQFLATEINTNTFIYSSTEVSKNLQPLASTTYNLESFPIQNFDGDSIVIQSKYWLSPNPSGNAVLVNDTVSRNQVFSNYLAYDDGSAEYRYELSGSPAFLAQQYHVNQPDSISAIGINFQYSTIDLRQTLISLIIWKNIFDDDTLFREDLLRAVYTNQTGGFSLYRLSRPVAVSDTFYIGWQQSGFTNEVSIDVGFDKNDISNNLLFINDDGTWRNSLFPGTVMMRPYFGNDIPFGVGIDETHKEYAEYKIFPNPVSDKLSIINTENAPLVAEVMDYSGKILIREKENSSSLDVHALLPGFYLIKITDLRTGESTVEKFIKSSY
ncbi:MAG: T9SS type A sorting domain-containing protein [Chitinophagales bacterium]|nr:T9SS type A sorting domain-containing protein [Chitinophagales bacterium]